MRLFVLYRLRAGVSFEEYRQWSVAADQPALHGSPHVRRFEVYAVEPVQGDSGWQVVELIDVAAWEDWEAASRSEALRALGPEFERLVDPSTVVILRGEPVAGSS